MIANEYFKSFETVIPERYADIARALSGDQKAEAEDLVKILYKMEKECGVENLRMSEYGIEREELEIICKNAVEYQGELFEIEPKPLSRERVMEILESSYQ